MRGVSLDTDLDYNRLPCQKHCKTPTQEIVYILATYLTMWSSGQVKQMQILFYLKHLLIKRKVLRKKYEMGGTELNSYYHCWKM
jgi:hypothetical protein